MACETTVTFSITVRPRAYFNGSSEQLLCDKDYPWIEAPENRMPKGLAGSIAAPAVGVLTEIFSYKVPDGYILVIDEDMHSYSGTNFIEGSGGIIWGQDINRPIGNNLLTGRPISQWIASSGSLTRPVKIGPFLIRGGDVYRYKVIITDPLVGVGAPNMIHAASLGWLYPASRN